MHLPHLMQVNTFISDFHTTNIDNTFRPEDVGEGVMELIRDLSKNGAVMTIMKDTDGQVKREFPELMDYSKL